MYNFSQEQVFIFFFIIGIIIGMIFDIFKVLRKAFKTSDKITFFEDLLFIVIATYLFVLGIINFYWHNNLFFDNKQYICYNFLYICKTL